MRPQATLIHASIFIAACAVFLPAKACFDDQTLLKEVAQSASTGQAALLYVWSDRMVYSVQQLPVVQQLALSQGLRFVPLQASEAACSAQLQEEQALRHFPTAFVITRQGLHRFPIVGAMPRSAWQQSLAQRLQE